ncbi:MAG: hypothetical protein JO115_04120 [Pseudonocardiales bacterium]|nr:hypothetical protein [Pseudonocardiales bacterium]
MRRPQPRTLLERLVQESDRTLEETCEDFERCARQHQERDATLSVRQLSRWMAGTVGSAQPASRRVAQRLWGHRFARLLGRRSSAPNSNRRGSASPSGMPCRTRCFWGLFRRRW